MKWRVYVDEAGNRGMSSRSSDHFTVAAVIVPDQRDAEVRQELASLRATLGRRPAQTLHFQKFTHSQRLKAIQDLVACSATGVTGVVICKRALSHPGPAGDTRQVSHPDGMYLWAIRLLLERISWYCRDHGGGSAIVTFAHVRHFPKQKLHDYRRALKRAQTLIHWDTFEGHNFRIGAPSTVELLQFADIAASALFRAVEPDDYGNVEPRYLQELAPMLYRRPPGDITSYGVKVFPSTVADAGPLRWLRGL